MKSRIPKQSGGSMASMMQKAQKMQEEMQAAQAELEEKEFTVAVGGGAVTAVISGKKELKSLDISKDVVDPDDIEMLQDLIISAVNEGIRQVEEASGEDMERITGGMSVPGLF